MYAPAETGPGLRGSSRKRKAAEPPASDAEDPDPGITVGHEATPASASI